MLITLTSLVPVKGTLEKMADPSKRGLHTARSWQSVSSVRLAVVSVRIWFAAAQFKQPKQRRCGRQGCIQGAHVSIHRQLLFGTIQAMMTEEQHARRSRRGLSRAALIPVTASVISAKHA